MSKGDPMNLLLAVKDSGTNTVIVICGALFVLAWLADRTKR